MCCLFLHVRICTNEDFLFKGSCFDPTPINGSIESIDQEPLPNGTYPIGTNAFVTCNFTGNQIYPGIGDGEIRCIQPGVWAPPPVLCLPTAEGQYKLDLEH